MHDVDYLDETRDRTKHDSNYLGRTKVANRFTLVIISVVLITTLCLVGLVAVPLLAADAGSPLVEKTCTALQQGFTTGLTAIIALLGGKAL